MDETLPDLLNDITILQDVLRTKWRYSKTTKCSGVDCVTDRAVRDDDGVATVIEPYYDYARVWWDADFFNPLLYYWRNFHALRDMPYLINAIDVLDSMMTLWAFDTATRECSIFQFCEAYVRALKRLYLYCLTNLDGWRVETSAG